MLLVGHTRFSLYSPDSGAWVASNGSKLTGAEYKDYLFSEERMDPRCEIFFSYTLPMLDLASKKYTFKHVVSYSEELPARYKDQLVSAAAKFAFLVLDEVPEGGGGVNIARLARDLLQENGYPAVAPFGMMRLDDDDVLSLDYFDQVSAYITESNVGFVVSLARGVAALYEGGQFHYARDAHFPLHSKGHLSVCAYGESGDLKAPVPASHNKADRYNPTIVDGRKVSHLWVRSITQDTALYQLQQGTDAMLARIYTDMDQYPAIASSVDDSFPVMAGLIHAKKPAI